MEKEKEEAAKCDPIPSSADEFQIAYYLDSLTVNLETKTCTCRSIHKSKEHNKRRCPDKDKVIELPIKRGRGRPRKNLVNQLTHQKNEATDPIDPPTNIDHHDAVAQPSRLGINGRVIKNRGNNSNASGRGGGRVGTTGGRGSGGGRLSGRGGGKGKGSAMTNDVCNIVVDFGGYDLLSQDTTLPHENME